MEVVRSSWRWRMAALALAGVLVLGGTASASRLRRHLSVAAPWFILVYDGPVTHRVLMSNWQENQELMVAVSLAAPPVSNSALAGRPFARVAMFWGWEWMSYPHSAEALQRLTPEQANQHARYYPARGVVAPRFIFDSGGGLPTPPERYRAVSRAGLDIFARYGVPAHVP